MSEDHDTLRISLPQPLIAVAGIVVGLALCALLLLLSGRAAGAAVLSPPPGPVSAVTTTLGDVVTTTPSSVAGTIVSPDPVAAVVASVASDASQVASGGSSAVQSLGGPAGLAPVAAALPLSAPSVLPLSAPPVLPSPALSVLSPPTPLVLGDVVHQGPQTTPTLPSRSASVTTLGVVLRTGSAGLFFSHRTSTRSAPADGHPWPLEPMPAPRRPSVPELPPVAVGATSGSGFHTGTLDALPPAVLVLALLAAGGVCLERRRRPIFRYDLRFSPPG